MRNARRNAWRPGSSQALPTRVARSTEVRSALRRRSLLLGGSQRSVDAAIVLEELFSSIEPDQTSLRDASDVFADLNDLVFKIADALTTLNCARLCAATCGRDLRGEDPRD